jgi:translation initiation factor 2B subunit (eIF-2B alpha/beta/delta family)
VEDDDVPARLGEISLFLVGADTVFRDGTLCNKLGTAALAEAAAAERVPTVVAAEVIKLAPIDASEAPALDAEALFDLTPAKLIDEIVTEEGTHSIEEVRALVDRTPFLREGYALLRGEELGS